MTAGDPGAQPPPATADERWDDDIDAAELEAAEDEAERARQKKRSTLVGGVTLLIAVALTAIGVYNVTARLSEPAPPGVVQQMPSPPPAAP